MDLNENETIILNSVEEQEREFDLLLSWELECLYTTLRGKSLIIILLDFNKFLFKQTKKSL